MAQPCSRRRQVCGQPVPVSSSWCRPSVGLTGLYKRDLEQRGAVCRQGLVDNSGSASLLEPEKMAVKVLLLLAAILATVTASASTAAETKDDNDRDGRFIFTSLNGTGNTTSVTIGLSNIILGGLLLVGLIAIVVFLSRQSDAKEGYSEPTSYSSAPAAEESYAIHRYLENAAERYDH